MTIKIVIYLTHIFQIPMKSLTKAEEQVMQVIWKLQNAFLGEILTEMAELQVQRTTIATVIKVLMEKKFVAATVIGRNHRYYPLISKKDYSKTKINNVVEGYFDGSYSNVLSFLMKEKKLSIKELEKALQQIKEFEKGNNE